MVFGRNGAGWPVQSHVAVRQTAVVVNAGETVSAIRKRWQTVCLRYLALVARSGLLSIFSDLHSSTDELDAKRVFSVQEEPS